MTLTGRIVIAFCIFAFSLAFAFMLGGRNVLDRVENTLLSLNADNVSAAALGVLQRSEDVLTAHARTIGRERAAVSALSEGDYEQLKETLRSTFNRISASGDISDLIIFNTDGRPVANFGSTEETTTAPVLSPLMVDVMDSGRRAFDIASIDGYRYGAVYAFPILAGRTPIGYGMLAYDAKASLPEIAEVIGGGVILTENVPGQGSRVLGHVLPALEPLEQTPGAGETSGQVSQNDMPASERVIEAAVAAFDNREAAFDQVMVGERTLVVARSLLGTTAADTDLNMLLLLDFTAQAQAKDNAIFTALSAFAAVVVIFLSAVLIWLRIQLRPLKEGTRALVTATNGDTPPPLRSRSKAREIAELRSAIESLLDQRAAERSAADEIATVVEACARGDFSKALTTDDKEGIFAEICLRVNSIGTAANEGLEAVREALEHLERQNLTHRMPDHFEGVFHDIALSVNAAAKKLSQTMQTISETSKVVANSSSDLARSTETISNNSTRNAASLEETAAALEEVSVTVGSMANAAQDANSSVNDISAKAAGGLGLMTQAVDAMKEVEVSTEAIAGILSVIEDISFQTNLLALNAGVEAARAGDAGRGFAVVASEVRALAQRSADSAKKISTLIKTSSETVDRGVKLVRATGEAFDGIVAEVSSAADQTRHISSASEEISTGIRGINTAMSDLDTATQQSASVLHNTHSAVQETQHQSRILASEISAFEIGLAIQTAAADDKMIA